MTKYSPLGIYFNKETKNLVSLSFSQIEKIIKAKLPPSAYSRKEWWANDSVFHTQSRNGWLRSGWKTKKINLEKQYIIFWKKG